MSEYGDTQKWHLDILKQSSSTTEKKLIINLEAVKGALN